ncbi:MAG TPA: peptide-methionine (S)-S-oxide reductase MsrA [Methylomusa anaerophila]|uniref:Peptide methionine sulfoxide reductase MsrA n=1 Tax=Methylomusa anaerophila TaxID=1930071 RepID=A0A348ALN5_9FIRM|nr:peptide-methionine (S)-S-oxide reductase MsrA [Methylomusa anaerophila]BBB91983.1 peptide methionine sulfoxide reductase MsrA/MsrB [Methylomusa anaerophila]HML88004.1 peptide-methionine (S)-S-oxide reductase MsrA [Methylomusa anaerophila]
MKKIWLAGGCFWGVEAYFQQLKGVLATIVGYGQGNVENPSYRQVCSGLTGHTEVCEVTYDESVLSLRGVLEHFFRIIDPTALNRQGPDRGTQYRTGVYFTDEGDRQVMMDYIAAIRSRYREPIVVEVEPLRNFYPAEEYHQDYLGKTPGGYCHVNLNLARPEERKLI